MASTKFFLDTRRSDGNNPSPLKIAVRSNNTTAYVNTGVKLMPLQWDLRLGKIVNHPLGRQFDARVSKLKSEIDIAIFDIGQSQNISKWKASDLKAEIEKRIKPKDYAESKDTFFSHAMKFIETKSARTKEIYEATVARLRAFEPDIENMAFEDLTVEWLHSFESFLSKTSPSKNARNIHLRNIRAIFNNAIDFEITCAYPFRRFKIRPEATRKRSLSVEELREIFDYPVDEYAEIYRDMFKLIFLLIGINVVDLHRLTEIKKGRIEYKRAKTGRLYSIKVEPEALEIINKYKGKNGLLCIADRWIDHRNFFRQMNKALQKIGSPRSGLGGKKGTGKWPELTSYWARHTWATIARKIGVSVDDIALALGHADDRHETTFIYIDEEQVREAVDTANRRVIDWVLYGKK